MENLVNGKTPQTKHLHYVTFKEFYNEQNEAKKTLLRSKMQEVLNLTETSIFRKIRTNDFDTHELRDMFLHIGVGYSPKEGFFFDSEVAILETSNSYGLS